MGIESGLKDLFDCTVTFYVGPHTFHGWVCLSDSEDMVTVQLADTDGKEGGLAHIRAEAVTAYVIHAYPPTEPE